ncbi:MAG: CHAT domain-containing protein [Okeania sp. SIO3B5]|uniref:CHAT domain-containing protein n=1 Tax=Okeania sp. SIO3B5 TaxID=2607811 RepID=UPI0013FEDB2A|nr:CHAT domain-containing protein [Okeania sp. SIO3B5]NEO52678.1 CHAT domain-containing protein [Okeania sp. SIO3B5]
MSQTVIIPLGKGDLKTGFTNMKPILSDDRQKLPQDFGITSLPAAPNILEKIQKFKTIHEELLRGRSSSSVFDNKDYSKQGVQDLIDRLKKDTSEWLENDSFKEIIDKLKVVLNFNKETIFMLEFTNYEELGRIPWETWKLIEQYPKAGIALTKPQNQPVQKVYRKKIRILAILSDAQDIDNEEEKKILDSLPKNEVETIYASSLSREKLTDLLWDQGGWDILLFSGHSETEGEQGRIYINNDEKDNSLTIGELKEAVKKAIERGLQLAIFNSCNGLGLASSLAELNIPAVIVMKEKVDNVVAQKFFCTLLPSFREIDNLPLAVKEAKKQLEGLEGKYLGASLLPVLSVNKNVGILRWSQLQPITQVENIKKIRSLLELWEKPIVPDWKKIIDEFRSLNSPKNQKKPAFLLCSLFLVEPNDLHGNSYVSQKLAQASSIVAPFVNVINVFSTLFLLLIVKSPGFIMSWSLALLFQVIIIKLVNIYAEGATAKQSFWGRINISTVGLILLNVFRLSAFGVGIELFSNQPGLKEKLAEDIVQEYVFEPREKELKQQKEPAIEARQECKGLQQQVDRLPSNNPDYPERDKLFQETHGLWEDYANQNSSKSYEKDPISEWPACPKANRLEANYDRVLKAVEEKRTEVKNYGSVLAYIKDVKPKLYENSFNEVGEIRYDMRATLVASNLFIEKLFSFQSPELRLFCSILIITSILPFIPRYNEDVQMSHSKAVNQAKRDFIEEIRNKLYQNQNQLSPEDYSLCQQILGELKETGRCDYQPFVDYVKYARKMEKTRYLLEDLEKLEIALEKIINRWEQLKNSSIYPETASPQDIIITDYWNDIKDLISRYLPNDKQAQGLIEEVKVASAANQKFGLSPVAIRRSLYSEVVLSASDTLSDRLCHAIEKKYNSTIRHD